MCTAYVHVHCMCMHASLSTISFCKRMRHPSGLARLRTNRGNIAAHQICRQEPTCGELKQLHVKPDSHGQRRPPRQQAPQLSPISTASVTSTTSLAETPRRAHEAPHRAQHPRQSGELNTRGRPQPSQRAEPSRQFATFAASRTFAAVGNSAASSEPLRRVEASRSSAAS
jgi:hypothetical protein